MPPKKPPTPPSTAERFTQINKQHTELIVEIRALAMQVRTLHNIFVKRTVLWWVLGIETVLVVGALIGVFTLTAINHSDTNKLINKFEDSCKVRNAQINGTKNFITDTQRLQSESEAINNRLLAQLNLHLSPADQKAYARIQRQYVHILKRYHDSQPKPLTCHIGGD